MPPSLWLSGLAASASLLWIATAVRSWIGRRDAIVLADLEPIEPAGGWPTLAVIFAARDEAPHVEQAARSLLAQDYPALEIVAVDDRSRDATGAILDAVAATDPRLDVVHVADLPPGWLGKTHALELGAEDTAAEWLLFTDADVHHTPGTLKRAISFATSQEIDHLVLTPEDWTELFGERLFLVMFLALFCVATPPWAIRRRDRRNSIGIGAFNLVRAEAFRSIGGLRNLALSVDDDMRLGQALKWAGYEARLLNGMGSIGLRWQHGLGGMIRGLEKNFFAATEFRPVATALGILFLLGIGILPWLGLLVGPLPGRIVSVLGVASLAWLVNRAGRPSRVRWWHGLLAPLSTLILAYTLIRSTVLTYRRGGVKWRDHLYPLAELRAHTRQRNHWLRELWRSTR